MTDTSPQLIIVGHYDKIDSLAFSADGKYLISRSVETIIWNVKTGKILRVMPEEDFSSGSYLLEDKSVRNGTAKFEALLLKRNWKQARPGYRQVSPDGEKIADFILYPDDRSTNLLVWEIRTGRILRCGLASGNCSLTFSTDGKLLAATHYNQRGAQIWDLRTKIWKRVLQDQFVRIFSASIAPGIRLIAVSLDGKDLWDAETGRLIYSFREEQEYFTYFSGPVGLLYRPLSLASDGKRIALERGQGIVAVREWERSRTLLWQTQSPGVYPQSNSFAMACLRAVAFSPNGHTLATGGDDHLIRLWDARTGELLNILGRNTLDIEAIAFAPDGNSLTALSDDGIARVWSLDEAKQMEEEPHNLPALACDIPQVWAAAAHLWTTDRSALTIDIDMPEDSKIVAISWDGNRIAVQQKDNALSLWDHSTRSRRMATLPDVGPFPIVVFSPDSRFLAMGGEGHPFHLLDLNWVGEAHLLTSCVRRAAFSSDSRLLAIEHDTGIVSIWETHTVTMMQVITSAYEGQAYMALSPDGKTLAVGDYYFDEEIVWLQHLEPERETMPPVVLLTDEEIHLQHSGQQRRRTPLRGHQGQVRVAVFSPDGTRLATGGTDGTIKLWNVADAELLATLLALPNKEWILFTPEGQYAASSGAETYIRWRARDALLPAHTYASDCNTLQRL